MANMASWRVIFVMTLHLPSLCGSNEVTMFSFLEAFDVQLHCSPRSISDSLGLTFNQRRIIIVLYVPILRNRMLLCFLEMSLCLDILGHHIRATETCTQWRK